jgi:hypothetical protein
MGKKCNKLKLKTISLIRHCFRKAYWLLQAGHNRKERRNDACMQKTALEPLVMDLKKKKKKKKKEQLYLISTLLFILLHASTFSIDLDPPHLQQTPGPLRHRLVGAARDRGRAREMVCEAAKSGKAAFRHRFSSDDIIYQQR